MQDQTIFMRYQFKLQNEMMHNCFTDCVNSFSQDSLSSGEKSCIQNCGKRYV